MGDQQPQGAVEGAIETIAGEAETWGLVAIALIGAVLAALLLHAVVFWAARRVARRTDTDLDETMVKRTRGPAALLFAIAALQLTLPAVAIPEGLQAFLRHVASLGLIAGVAWLLMRILALAERAFLDRFDITHPDNLQARHVHTQVRIIRRVLKIIIIVVAISVMLMTFPRVRQLGASLLASAGIAGLILGLAARPMLTNIIAGLQIALASPIRLDDVVIMQGEWGRIEEITSTYVVVRIWDKRRLVVPLSHVLEQPFQNWTRVSSDLLGTVNLYVDYTAPVDAIRAETKRICENSADWDREVCVVQVTDADDRTMLVRPLVSAADSGKLWNLRCEVREKLIAFLQREHPGCLPREREERVDRENRSDVAEGP